MYTYKNLSCYTKKFHGVIFKPGDVKTVSRPINYPRFVRISNVAEVCSDSVAVDTVENSNSEIVPTEVVEDVVDSKRKGRSNKSNKSNSVEASEVLTDDVNTESVEKIADVSSTNLFDLYPNTSDVDDSEINDIEVQNSEGTEDNA